MLRLFPTGRCFRQFSQGFGRAFNPVFFFGTPSHNSPAVQPSTPAELLEIIYDFQLEKAASFTAHQSTGAPPPQNPDGLGTGS